MTVFFLFEKKKRKAINELNRQLEYIYIIKHDIITLFFDSHEFELEITRKKTLGNLFGFLREDRLKNLEFSFSPEKKIFNSTCTGRVDTCDKFYHLNKIKNLRRLRMER